MRHMLDVYQAADALGCSHWHIRELVRRGSLPQYRGTRGRILVSSEDLDAYVETTRVAPAAVAV